MNKRNSYKSKNKRYNFKFLGLVILLAFAVCCAGIIIYLSLDNNVKPENNNSNQNTEVSFDKTLEKFAKKNDLELSEWKQEYIDKAKLNPELEDFVLNYPLKKDKEPKINLNEIKNYNSVPLLMQWDERWGYSKYAGDLMGFTGCGPTCLSMVSIYILKDNKYNPKYIADFSKKNGYSMMGSGSSWTLISEGGKKLGFDVVEIPLVEKRIVDNLKVGNPIICVVGPGDFTTKGHFIVMTGYVDGKIKINDPNSKERSEKLWEYNDIKDQIKNLWVCRAK